MSGISLTGISAPTPLLGHPKEFLGFSPAEAPAPPGRRRMLPSYNTDGHAAAWRWPQLNLPKLPRNTASAARNCRLPGLSRCATAVTAGVGGLVLLAVIVGVSVGTTRHHPARATGTADAFKDTFETLNTASWSVANAHTNGGAYACGFTNTSLATLGGGLSIDVFAGNFSGEKYGCGQIMRNATYQYGLFSASLQAARGAGIVTAAFTYTETAPAINQEIDIEITGANTSVVWLTAWKDGVSNATAVPLGFDAADRPHTYAFAWRDTFIAWSVDGQEVHRLAAKLPVAVPTHYYVSTWLRQPNGWVGAYDVNAPRPPTHSHFDWVAYAP